MNPKQMSTADKLIELEKLVNRWKDDEDNLIYFLEQINNEKYKDRGLSIINVADNTIGALIKMLGKQRFEELKAQAGKDAK